MTAPSALTGTVILVTGATSGIGRATAGQLAARGATVVLTARDAARGEHTRKEIAHQTGNNDVHLLTADLSSQAAVRQAAQRFRDTFDRLDVLINNAGVNLSRRTVTVDGIETTLAVNHLAPFLLTNLLLEPLRAAAPSRVVTVTSSAHAGRWNPAVFEEPERYQPMRVYAQSKLANILFTEELSRRLGGTGTTANSVHPGVVNTGLARDITGPAGLLIRAFKPLFARPQTAARRLVWAATAPELRAVTGQYLTNQRISSPKPGAHDRAAALELWRASERLTGYTGLPLSPDPPAPTGQ